MHRPDAVQVPVFNLKARFRIAGTQIDQPHAIQSGEAVVLKMMLDGLKIVEHR